MSLPSGAVTFLFTDIEGSGKLWENYPEQMRAALMRHDSLAASLIGQHNGHVVKSRGEGESLFAVFSLASDAVAAAVALQQAFVKEPWPAEAPLKVRIALHTGEADVRNGDYYGPAVNRCARLRAIAHGRQVVLTQPTERRVRGALPKGAGLTDLGHHKLRDLDTKEQIFQLTHPDLPNNFPPLTSIDSFPNNLPRLLTSFVGREKEMEEIKRLLESASLLTLIGSGGCGKTRLTIQVGFDLLFSYPDGVYIVELAALTDAVLVPQAVASALGMREEPGRPITQTLIEYLQDKRALIILDNCEHMVQPSAQIADTLLRNCPKLRMFASSREGLGIEGETTYRIPSLSLPDPRQPQTAATLSRFEAVRLFVERARAAQPDFAVTDQNANAVTQLCVRLDGIPLALELAAARVKALSVEQIASRLDDRFRLLTNANRTVLPRQQTLKALIDWSYDLLNEKEQTLLQRLSVFSGGWTLEEAEKVCSDTQDQSEAHP
jgi:class 3 adenylate cyclase